MSDVSLWWVKRRSREVNKNAGVCSEAVSEGKKAGPVWVIGSAGEWKIVVWVNFGPNKEKERKR